MARAYAVPWFSAAGALTWTLGEETMVTRDTAWAGGTPCWVDLGVPDIPKASAFYAALKK